MANHYIIIDKRSDQERLGAPRMLHKCSLTKKEIEWRRKHGHLIDQTLMTDAVKIAGGYWKDL